MFPISRKNDLVVQEAQDELLVYDLRSNKAICLNETSAAVWQHCDGKNSAAEIAAELETRFKSPVTDDLVWLALDQLREFDLLDNPQVTPEKFKGMPRREVMKTIGLASMIALPIVTGLIAPVAVHASSCEFNKPGCAPTGAPCTTDMDCCSCLCSPMMNQCKA